MLTTALAFAGDIKHHGMESVTRVIRTKIHKPEIQVFK
jgi:hypothetical protein